MACHGRRARRARRSSAAGCSSSPFWDPVDTGSRRSRRRSSSPSDWQEAVSSILAVAARARGHRRRVADLRRDEPVAVPRVAFWQRTLEHKLYFDERTTPSSTGRPSGSRSALAPLGRGAADRRAPARDIGDDTRDLGGLVARLQTGLLRTYALAIASSVAVLAVVFVAVQ